MVSLGDLALPGVSVDADALWAHAAGGMPSAEKDANPSRNAACTFPARHGTVPDRAGARAAEETFCVWADVSL